MAGVCPPTISTDALFLALRALFTREPAVRVGYLVEVHRGADDADVFLQLVLAAGSGGGARERGTPDASDNSGDERHIAASRAPHHDT